jgi:bifunctional DNase/RNase
MEPMLEAELWTISQDEGGCRAFLRVREQDAAVPLFLDEGEGEALLRAARKTPAPERPLVHDLLAEFIEKAGFRLIRAELYEGEDELWRARLVFTGRDYPGETPLVLEARPSDALVLVLRTGGTLFVSQAAVEETGVPADQLLGEMKI